MTRKAQSLLGSAIFLVIAPGFIAGVVPRWISGWQMRQPLWGFAAIRVLGGLLALAGILVLVDSFLRFALQGIGTPAPVFPTRHLVVTGLYRYVRNPMYVAVLAIIFGQGLLFGNVAVLEYGALIWLAFYLFVLAYEEPTLTATFGAEYQSYCAKVPRWLPRIRTSAGS